MFVRGSTFSFASKMCFFYVYEYFTCMHLWLCFPQRPENGIRPPETGVTEGCGNHVAVEKRTQEF